MSQAKLRQIAVARAVVDRVDGSREVHYSYERIPITDLRRWLKLRAHLRMMRDEDKDVLRSPRRVNDGTDKRR